MNAGRMGIVVVNYGSHALLDENLSNVPDDYLVVVVDNFYSLDERQAAAELAARRAWRFIAMPDNPGYGRACNAGLELAREAGCTTLMVLNPDARITRAVLDELHGHVESRPTELVSPRIADSTGRYVFVGVDLLLRNGRMRRAGTGNDDGDDDGNHEAAVQFWLTGACVAFSETLLDDTGGFADAYFLYWEDVELSTRAARAGYTLTVRHDLVVVHDEGGTQNRTVEDRAKSDTYYYYNTRNRLLFAARMLSRRRQLAWLVATPAASWEILMRGGRRQLLANRTPLWAALTGTGAGVFAVLRRLVARRPGDESAVATVR